MTNTNDGRVPVSQAAREATERARQDALYADEPWAKMAVQAGFRPYDTEASARRAFEFAAQAQAELVEALRAIQKTMDGYRSQMKFCDVEALGYFREFDRRIEASGFRALLARIEGRDAA